MVLTATLAGPIERTHRPGRLAGSCGELQGQGLAQAHSILSSYRWARSSGPSAPSTFFAFSTSRPRSGWIGHSKKWWSVRPGMKLNSAFWKRDAARRSFSRKQERTKNRAPRVRGSNPGLQLTNPFRHDGWQAPTGAPAQSGQWLGRIPRWRRQPSRRMRPAMHAARRARTGICN